MKSIFTILFVMFCVTCFSQVTNIDGANVKATIVNPIFITKEEKDTDLVFEYNQDFYYEILVTADTNSVIVENSDLWEIYRHNNKLYIKKEKNQTIIFNYN